jgi:hypothetical protein
MQAYSLIPIFAALQNVVVETLEGAEAKARYSIYLLY